MKLSRIYSSKPGIFEPVEFVAGLNVVLAEIRLPDNKKKDTHNLGKTTFGRLVDFCLLSSRDKNFFLFKHHDQFKGFVFFIEIELLDGGFVTIRRCVDEASKISFKKHQEGKQDFSALADSRWDHLDVPFERAKDLLDGLLDLRAIKPWPYRKSLGYLLRSQDDFRDVFHLRKFVSSHADWKPFLAHVLGFDAQLIEDHYSKEDEIEKKQAIAQTLKSELGGSVGDISKIEGVLLLKQKEAEKKQKLLDAFDFRSQDKEKTKQLVDDIDGRIAQLNGERYSLTQNRKKILTSLEEEQILFNPDDAENLFREAGVLFQGQIKRDFQQLIAFNKSITEERRGYLKEELAEIYAELKRVNGELNELGKCRSSSLSFLSGTDVFNKYKHVSDELITLKADITSLERQRGFLQRHQELRKEIRTLTEEKDQLQTQIEDDCEKQHADRASLFSQIRLYFSEIVEEVIDRKALLSVPINKEGHLEFKAEILDESGNTTSADKGYTYQKLLCIAFDMALLRAHSEESFPRFIFHDGVLESLDDRKKENLLGVIRRYAEIGIQHVITLIDSDLPAHAMAAGPVFDDAEIVLWLHDESERGRLFKMKGW
jgi:uncharacterized protein YydD (DUF2326 family)